MNNYFVKSLVYVSCLLLEIFYNEDSSIFRLLHSSYFSR